MNPELSRAVRDHIQEHIDMLRTVNPDILMLIKEQPLNPVQAAGAPGLPPGPMSPDGMSGPAPMPMGNQQVVNNSSINDVMNPLNGGQAGPTQAIPNQPNIDPSLLPNPALDPRAQ